MKKIFFVAVFFFGLNATQAQELKWYTDVKEAAAVGKKQKKPLMLFFTGSDWCGWCIRLQKEVLLTPEFKKWAKEKVVLVELDYPRKNTQSDKIKQQNTELQNAFGIQGYPTVHFANATNKDGKVDFQSIGKTGYVPGGPVAWLEVANGILSQK